jgi:hypothetical protein
MLILLLESCSNLTLYFSSVLHVQVTVLQNLLSIAAAYQPLENVSLIFINFDVSRAMSTIKVDSSYPSGPQNA